MTKKDRQREKNQQTDGQRAGQRKRKGQRETKRKSVRQNLVCDIGATESTRGWELYVLGNGRGGGEGRGVLQK